MPDDDFTPKELEFISDTSFLLTKRLIIDKAVRRLKNCHAVLEEALSKNHYGF